MFNSTRNMFGYTGTYKGKRVSVMRTGMGMPSIGIYSYELIHPEGVAREFKLPESIVPVNILAIGYADDEPASP